MLLPGLCGWSAIACPYKILKDRRSTNGFKVFLWASGIAVAVAADFFQKHQFEVAWRKFQIEHPGGIIHDHPSFLYLVVFVGFWFFMLRVGQLIYFRLIGSGLPRYK